MLLLSAVPVSAAPPIQKGSHSSYNFSVSISFIQTCEATGSTAPTVIACPLTATLPSSLDISGMIGWEVTDLNSTTATLNVTRVITMSNLEGGSPLIRTSSSFNESINLATRIVSFPSIIMPEMNQILHLGQATLAGSVPAGLNLTSSMSSLDNVMVARPLYTMWWVSGPLGLNQTVPILVLPTNVTRASSVDLGSTLGTRSAWALDFNLSHAILPLESSTASTSITSQNSLNLAFAFNYDQTSDLLLSASANIHSQIGEDMTIPPIQCDPSATVCPASSSTMVVREFGINVDASLILASTTVDLTHRMSNPDASQTNTGGSQPSGGSNLGTNTGSGANGGNSNNGDTSVQKGKTSGAGQPTGNTVRPTVSLLSGSLPWVYGLFGLLAAVIAGIGAWAAGRRNVSSRSSA